MILTCLTELQEELVASVVERCMDTHTQNACFYVTQMHTFLFSEVGKLTKHSWMCMKVPNPTTSEDYGQVISVTLKSTDSLEN